MWIGNVRNLSFQDQLKATVAVGLNEMSMTPLDVDRNQAKGISPGDMRKMAADLGVSLPILDPMASWAPRWRTGISDPGFMEFLGYSTDDFFRIADELGVSAMTVIGTLQPGLASVPEIAESFALLADRAAAHGLRCILEFIPIWGIKDLRMAWQILQIADRPNTALAFDFWHYIRGRRDDGLLRSIPGDRIAYVQVTDAEAEPPPRAITGARLFVPSSAARRGRVADQRNARHSPRNWRSRASRARGFFGETRRVASRSDCTRVARTVLASPRTIRHRQAHALIRTNRGGRFARTC